jgi:hypothetical protein
MGSIGPTMVTVSVTVGSCAPFNVTPAGAREFVEPSGMGMAMVSASGVALD